MIFCLNLNDIKVFFSLYFHRALLEDHDDDDSDDNLLDDHTFVDMNDTTYKTNAKINRLRTDVVGVVEDMKVYIEKTVDRGTRRQRFYLSLTVGLSFLVLLCKLNILLEKIKNHLINIKLYYGQKYLFCWYQSTD